jgi:ABC-type glycerol-3-phosphate transport system substrate-binding protein
MQDTLSREKLLLPSHKAAARSQDGFLKPAPAHVHAFIEGRAIGHMIHGRANDGNTIIAQELGKALTGEKTPKQALLDAQQQCQQILTSANCQQMDTFNYSFAT